MANLSLKIAVKLLTKSFKKGVLDLSTMLRGLQMQFMAFASTLGVGTVGLGNFLQRMRDVVKETTSANIVLKNVSNSAGEFAAHQSWLVSVSKKYGVQINTLTSGFAKFKAAADISNISLDSQRKIFESVARASVAFGLSSEDQRGVFMALQQMMSKGKVMAEELRLQLAERMPVAIQAMAKALGVSVTEMDALMKQGKVLSSDVLPKFAEELNKLIPNIDLDNLNKSLTDLSNTFVELTKKLNIEGAYKGLVDGINAILQWTMRSTKGIASSIWAFVGGVFGRMGTNIWNYFKGSAEQVTAHAEKLIKDKARAAESVARAEAKVADRTLAYQQAIDKQKALSAEVSETKKLEIKRRVASAEKALEDAKLSRSRAIEKQKQADALVTAEVIEQANLKNATSYHKFVVGFKHGIKSLGASLKAFAMSNIWTAIASALFGVVSYLTKLYNESRRIKRLADETRKELASKPELSSQEQDIMANMQVVKSPQKYNNETRLAALNKINKVLGTQYKLEDGLTKKRDEINAKVSRYINYLRAQQKLERAKSLVTSHTADFESWKQKNPGWEAKRGQSTPERMVGKSFVGGYTEDALKILGFETAIKFATSAVVNATAEVAKYATEFDSDPVVTTDRTNDLKVTDIKSRRETASELEKAQEEYRKSLAELTATYQAGVISEKEFQRQRKDLIEKTYINARSIEDKELLDSDFFKGIERDFGSFSHGAIREKEERLVDRIEEYNLALEEQKRSLDSGAIAQDEYQASLRNLSSQLYKELSKFDLNGLTAEMIAILIGKKTETMITNAQNSTTYTPRRRDTSRDFKRSPADMLAEQKKDAEHYLDWLRSQQSELIGSLADEINAQLAKVDSLDKALKLQRAQDEIKRLKAEVGRTAYDGLKGTISNIDGVVNAFDNLRKVMDDPDASGWEKFMAAFSAVTSVTDSILGVIQLIQMLSTVTASLSAAQEANAAASTAATGVQLANSQSLISAKTGEAAALAAADQAKIPFGWIAIPAVIAAVLAMFAALPKFAKGGVVGGNSRSGDKVLARLNSGEGVLTETGMEGLAEAARTKQTNVHITGELTASGRDLRIVLDRQTRFDKRIR